MSDRMGVDRPRSAALHAEARALMPGGVNSPVRAFGAVGGEPVSIASGEGAWVTDVDGGRYVDYIGSYGPLILGHAPAAVTAALTEAAARGTSFGMPTEAENELAKLVIEAAPGVERIRFVNSGTEAAMSAIRLARAATGRRLLIKCVGCYHGHSDALLVQAGSGATTLGTPSSPGVPPEVTSMTLLVPFNDVEAVASILRARGEDVAVVAVEPVAGNMGCIPPAPGYLESLRELCDQYGSLLLFDEVMTGFRVAWGGAAARYGVTPDVTCFGKVIGGGLPCAAYGGKAEVMDRVSPAGPVYQAGTLSGNPLAMAAGRTTLETLRDGAVYDRLEGVTRSLAGGLRAAAKDAGVAAWVSRVGSMVCLFFHEGPVRNYEDATACDLEAFARFFHAMLDEGVTLPPSQFETWFVSAAHGEAEVEWTLAAARKALAAASAMRG